MEILTPADILLLKATTLGAIAYGALSLSRKIVQKTITQPELPLLLAAKAAKPTSIQPTRSILKQLEQNTKTCMIFYGSQTGTAERFAHRFAREALERYDLGCIVADLDAYDFVDFSKLSDKYLMVFILATYGEGEPTDNAIPFRNFLNQDAVKADLQNLRYSAFGLGSSSYTYFNAMIQRVDETLASRDAQRIGSLGLGDDGKGTLEEDFELWIDTNLPLIAANFNLLPIPYTYKPAFEVNETPLETSDPSHIFLGEPNNAHLHGRIQGPFTPQNPFPAKITEARELFTSSDRNCLHLEFDVSNTSISYDTGDHLAVWPVNSDLQVDLFLDMFGLSYKREQVIEIVATDASTKVPIPAKTTYEAVARHYLDICAPVSRQTLQKLAGFTVSEAIRTNLLQLASNKSRFSAEVSLKQLTISQLLSSLIISINARTAIEAPFSLILELLPKLRPRHYSISSSSLVSRKQISITTVVDAREDPAHQISFRGVSTSYLSALKTGLCGTVSTSEKPTHSLQSAIHRQTTTTSTELRPLIHVRRSKFRPPFNPSVPIIMIGPGTGIAPFRAFIHERAYQHSLGRTIGRTVLFYGCRNSRQDYLYKDEWDNLVNGNRLGEGVLSVYTAFSREETNQAGKYVQDLIREDKKADEIRRLVREQGARIYVCGNAARMAKDVSRVMGQVLAIDGEEESEVVPKLKKEGRWHEDVW